MSLSLLKPRVGSDMIADWREFAQKVHLSPPILADVDDNNDRPIAS